MGFILCLAGFVGTARLASRSLGHGLGLLLGIGSAYGMLRANVYDGVTHFLFDASVLGFYLGAGRRIFGIRSGQEATLRLWVLGLCVLPLFLILMSPFIDSQPVVIQLIGLRPAMFFVPLILAGAHLNRTDIAQLGTWASFVAIGTGAVALGEYVWGLEPFLPLNSATEIIYRSRDVSEEMVHRIPSTFLSAHAYGGTMVAILPLLVLALDRGGRRAAFAGLAILTAVIGVFVCGARTPVVMLAVLALVLILSRSASPRLRVTLLAVAGAMLLIVPLHSRLQRFETLQDTEYVEDRVRASVNMGFFEAAANHPVGRGLGSAVGTSIPYFLENVARPQYGMENEYARIVLEEGILGAALWCLFVARVLLIDPRKYGEFGGTLELGAWVLCVGAWVQATVGTGLLASVPSTMILFLYMGLLAVQPERGAQGQTAFQWSGAISLGPRRRDA